MRNIKIAKNNIWRRGAGTILGFTICLVSLVSTFLIALSYVQINAGMTDLEEVSVLVGRDIIVCESLEDAQELAEEEIEEYFASSVLDHVSDIAVSVQYAAGSDESWKKGNYIVLYISGNINTVFLPARSKTVRNMVMIERNGS